MCQREFYEAGVQTIARTTGCKKVFVFSDRIDKVEKEGWFSTYETTFVKGCNAVEGLDLLKKCHHFVVANSTFSWWGAYLSSCKDKMIIAPRFFYSGITMEDSKIHLDDAIYLDNTSGEKISDIYRSSEI